MNGEKPSSNESFPASTLQWNDVIKVIGTIAGFVGLGGALLWLFGRYYFQGVISSFGFASIPLSIAPEDYLESGVTNLLYFIMDILASGFLYYLAYLAKVLFYEKILERIRNRIVKISSILLIFSVCVVTGAYLISTSELGITARFFYEDAVNLIGIFLIFLGLEVTFLIASPVGDSGDTNQQQSHLIVSPYTPLAIARTLMLVVMFASLLFTQAGSAFVSGRGTGCLRTLRKSTSVTVISASQILTEGETRSQDGYQYTGYFLLFADNDYYFLFRETNPESYMPKSYFIVDKEAINSIQITGITISKEDNEKYNKMCVEKIKGN